MLRHTTSNAIATLLMVNPDQPYRLSPHRYGPRCHDNYLTMTIALARNLREAGYEEDIVVITNHESYEEILAKEGVLIEHRSPFDYPALHHFKCPAWGLSLFDMAKIHYWDLWQYNRVLCLDCDILTRSKFTEWDNPNLLVQSGAAATINSGIMCITPSKEAHHDMRQFLRTASFSPESGWNECGLIKGMTSWRFQAANAAQGFIPFYFDNWVMYPWGRFFKHFAGSEKWQEPYLSKLKRYGLELVLPKKS